MKRILIFLLTLSFISCEKDKIEAERNLYAAITIDDIELFYTEKDSLYFDCPSFSYIIGGPFSSYTYGGGFMNGNYKIDNFRKTDYDQFIVDFHNTPFDSIRKGSYNFTGINNLGSYKLKGVEIIWMNPEMWEVLINRYLSSDEYKYIVKLNPNFNYLDIFDESYFMNSSNILNEGTVEVTNSYYKDYERYSFKDSSHVTFRDLIVEGKINECNIRSRIDTSIIKRLKGDFRIHLPYPQPLIIRK